MARADIAISTNSTWRIFRGTNEASGPIGTEWRTNTFDDSSWEAAPAPFYFGSSQSSGTLLGDMQGNYTCLFLRQTFLLTNVSLVVGLSNRPFADDGYIVWINGVEARRFDMFGTAGTFLPYYTNANIATYSAGWVNFNALTNILRIGTNVFAMQVFNVAASDVDFYANPEVAVRLVPGPLTVSSATPSFGATVSSLTQVSVVFNRPATGVSAEDFLINGIPATSVTGSNTTYTFTFTPPTSSEVRISWDGNHVILDELGARMIETNSTWTYTIVDTLAPSVVSLTPGASATVGSLTQVEVLFSEPVSGVDAGDLLVNGVPAGSAFGGGAGPYVFQFSQPPTGTVQLAWSASHNIRDNATSPNAFPGGSWTVTLNPALFTGDVIINEFTAANVVTNGGAGTLDLDEFNQTEDWIELYNRGTNSVRLLGWSLTDNPNQPGLWTFPDVTLGVGQYLVVYASGRDRKILGGTNRLHTSFGLNVNGEYLALFNAESPRRAMSEFTPEFPEQRNDYSYGLVAPNTWRYFNPPTPGAPNGSSSITNVVPKVSLNVDRGYFQTPFTLIASCAVSDATLRYTTDGSEPIDTSPVFSGSLMISNTTVLRIAAFRAGMLPSQVSTHTYLFLDQVVTQPNNPPGFPSNWGPNGGFPGGVVPADYEMDMDPLRVDPNNPATAIDPVKMQRLKDGLRELPIVSVVMKVDDIFGTSGLYQRSAVETGTPGTKPENKKPCSVEMILPDGTTAFTTTCGIDLHGNASRNPVKNPKHGFKLSFRGDFGPATLQYRMFEDSSVEEFDDLLLRADFNSSWRHWSDTAGQGLGAFQRTRATRTRDAWMKDAMREMGGLASHSRFVHLYLNGLYWGTFDISEDPSPVFAKTALGGTENDFDIIDQGVVKNGTIAAYNAMLALPAASTLAQYEQYKQYLDLTEFIDYMVLHYLMGHQDWAVDINKNWSAIRKRVSGPEGTFKYVPWDGECILLEPNVDRTTSGTPPSGLQIKLDDSPEYRLAFADRAHKHMIAPDGKLLPGPNIVRWQKWQAIMDKAIVAESTRWGDYRRDVHQYSEGVYQLYTRENHWVPENARMLGYFTNRTATVLAQLRAGGLYPNNTAPVFSQHGGRVAAGFALTITATNTIYYTTNGADPRLYGTGQVSPVARLYSGPISVGETMTVKTRMLAGTNWSALNEATFTVSSLTQPLRITEIMYNPVGGDAYEYLELQNTGTVPLNVGNYSFNGISFTFPFGFTINAGQRIILGSSVNTNAFAVRYPGVVVAGWYGGALANGGETIGVLDGLGRVVTSVSYDDENGWVTAADGGGFSLEVMDASADPDDAANWRASGAQNGTPGQPNSALPAGSIVLNEVMAENISAVNHDGTFPDYVELFNPTGNAIDLTSWGLTDDSNGRKYVFPNGTLIGAGGYLVVWCDTNATSGLHSGFALGRNGETVSLYDAGGLRVDGISFGPQLANLTIGRVPNGSGAWALNSATPGAVNVAAALAAASSLTINEWLADAVPGGDDFVELFNTNAVLPVALRNLYVGTSNELYQIESLSFIGPRGYLALSADGNAGADHLDFRLPAGGGAIVLYDVNGAELQRVVYGLQGQGVSQGRLPDGATSLTNFVGSVSPGAANYVINYTGPVLNEVLARNSTLAAPWGEYADYLELYNPNPTNFPLAGLGLSDEAGQIKFVFAPGTSIAAGGYTLVWCDSGHAASSNGVFNAGFSLAGSSGGAYLFNTAGQLVNFIEYGFQVKDLPIGLSGGSWKLLASATPGAANAAAAALGAQTNVRINEWMAQTSGNDWFELHNLDALPVTLSGLYLTDDLSLAGLSNTPIALLSFIGGKDFVQWQADGDPSQGRDHARFDLDKDGDNIRIYANDFSIIDSVSFGGQVENVSQGRLPDGGTNIVSFPTTPTPDASNYLPLSDIAISEALTHTDPPLVDAIEIQNVSGGTVDVSGWFISNSQTPLQKFRIAAGTTLAPGAFVVFTETNFNADGSGSGTNFTLNSAHGDTIYLSQTDGAGNLTGYRAQVSFGAGENGVSFGRFVTSVGADFTAMATRTLGVANSYPKIGPVIINEIMYHPNSGGLEYGDEEFIELYNMTGAPVPMFDTLRPTNVWKLRGAVSFNFNASITIPANGRLLLVDFDPVFNPATTLNFRAKYGTNGTLAGPYSGRLNNAGEALELYKPDAPQAAPHPDIGFVPMILVDRVVYSPLAPWPVAADGGGASLQRLASTLYGNEPLNWKAEPPTAGATNIQGALIAPTIAAQPTNRTVALNATVSFTVTANGSVPLSYQWQHSGTNLPGANSATLTISAAQLTDAGAYHVIVTNLGGTITSADALLTVLSPPVVSTPPASQTVVAGVNVQLNVSAFGTAPLNYQWRRNGADLVGQTSAPLNLNSIQAGQAGNYTVVITNVAGSVTSAVAVITVLVAPTITGDPTDQTVFDGDPASFTVSATGTAPLGYQWRKNGANILGANAATYTIPQAHVSDEAAYSVVVSNAAGSATSLSAQLRINVAPFLSQPKVRPDRVFEFTLNGPTNRTYTIEYTVNFGGWTNLTNFLLLVPQTTITDPTSPNAPTRFYRVRTP